ALPRLSFRVTSGAASRSRSTNRTRGRRSSSLPPLPELLRRASAFRSLLRYVGAIERWRIREACRERGRLRPATAAVALALAGRVGIAGVLGPVLARGDHFLAGLGAHGAAAAGLDAVVRGRRRWFLRRCRLAR